MYLYWIGGQNYNKVMVDVYTRRGVICSDQYYVYGQAIVKRSLVEFNIKDDVLEGISTDDRDTVILPKSCFKSIGPYAVKGCAFQRLVMPRNIKLRLQTRSLYGNEELTDYISLSRNIEYDDNVFPRTIERRCF